VKDQTRILSLRIDTLSQMMNLGNVRPGGRYIVVDDASGMVVSAVLERLGGNGRLITICDVDSPPAYPVMTQMNFPKELIANVLSSLNWGTADKAYTPSLGSFIHLNRKRLITCSRPLCRARTGVLWFG